MSSSTKVAREILETIARQRGLSSDDFHGIMVDADDLAPVINQLLIETKQKAVKPYYRLEFAVEEAIKNGVFMPSVEDAYEELQQSLKEDK